MNWESLIAERMRPAKTAIKIHNYYKYRKSVYSKKRYEKLKNDEEYQKNRLEKQRIYRTTSESYKKKRNEYMRNYRKTHIMTEHEYELHRDRNRRYRQKMSTINTTS